MRRAALITTLALLAACKSRSEAAPAPARPDVLTAPELKLVERVNGFLATPTYGVDLIRPVEVGVIGRLRVRAIGFGATAHAHPVFDGDHWCTFGALERNGRTAMVRVECGWKAAAPAFASFDAHVERSPRDRGVVFTWQDTRAMEDLRADAAKVIGTAPRTAPPPDDLRAAFELLSSPLADARVGDACGDDGQVPESKKAAVAIAKRGRDDLLRAAARGLNPDGRIQAIRMLRTRPGGLVGDDAALVDRLKRLDVPIHTCRGCTHLDDEKASVVIDDARL